MSSKINKKFQVFSDWKQTLKNIKNVSWLFDFIRSAYWYFDDKSCHVAVPLKIFIKLINLQHSNNN